MFFLAKVYDSAGGEDIKGRVYLDIIIGKDVFHRKNFVFKVLQALILGQ